MVKLVNAGYNQYLWNRESLGNIYLGTNQITRISALANGNVGIGTDFRQAVNLFMEKLIQVVQTLC